MSAAAGDPGDREVLLLVGLARLAQLVQQGGLPDILQGCKKCMKLFQLHSGILVKAIDCESCDSFQSIFFLFFSFLAWTITLQLLS